MDARCSIASIQIIERLIEHHVDELPLPFQRHLLEALPAVASAVQQLHHALKILVCAIAGLGQLSPHSHLFGFHLTDHLVKHFGGYVGISAR